MFNPNSHDFFKTTITKTDDKYVVADYKSEGSLVFTDLMDAKAAALLIEAGIPILDLDDMTIMQFKLQLIAKASHKSVN